MPPSLGVSFAFPLRGYPPRVGAGHVTDVTRHRRGLSWRRRSRTTQTEGMAKPQMIDDDALDDLERELIGRAAGRVLELGAGRGENFGAFAPDVIWHGLEPDAERRVELARRAREWRHEAAPMDAVAEHVPLAAASIDTVVATYVMCTVSDVDAALREARRVLVPGGRVLLVEHVLAPHSATMRALQHIATPFTKRWCGGCHQDRNPLPALRAAGFTDVEVRHRRVHDRPLPPESILLYEGRAPAGR